MCHTQRKLKAQWTPELATDLNDFHGDNSYYPGINHGDEVDMELEEYIWSIHKCIDAGVILTKFKRGGYTYVPYVPSMVALYDDDDTFSTHINTLSKNIADLYGNTMTRLEPHFSMWSST